MTSKATTVEEYLAELPDDRREAIRAVREVILRNLPEGCEEGMQYGMIGYYVPHRVYPPGYHVNPKDPLGFAHLASQKGYMALYLGCIYIDAEAAEWFREAYLATGKRLDMGKSCVRFRKLEDLPLDLIGQAVARMSVPEFIQRYEQGLAGAKRRR